MYHAISVDVDSKQERKEHESEKPTDTTASI
jgi:hypothetical protein